MIWITPLSREIPFMGLSTGRKPGLMRLPGDIHTIHRFYYYYDESLYKKSF